MAQDDDGRRIGRLIDTLAPDLPSPPDRIAAIGRRVRRRRTVAAAAAAACLALALVVPVGLRYRVDADGPPPAAPEVVCPPEVPAFGGSNGSLPTSAPGDLAPPGAVRAVM